MRNWVCLANRIFYLFDVIVGRHSAHSYTISHLHRDRGIPSSSLATVTYRKTNAQWRRRWLLVVVRWRKSRRWADWTKPTRRMYVCCVCVYAGRCAWRSPGLCVHGYVATNERICAHWPRPIAVTANLLFLLRLLPFIYFFIHFHLWRDACICVCNCPTCFVSDF